VTHRTCLSWTSARSPWASRWSRLQRRWPRTHPHGAPPASIRPRRCERRGEDASPEGSTRSQEPYAGRGWEAPRASERTPSRTSRTTTSGPHRQIPHPAVDGAPQGPVQSPHPRQLPVGRPPRRR